MHKEYILLNGFRKAKKGFTAGFHVPLIQGITFEKARRATNRSLKMTIWSLGSDLCYEEKYPPGGAIITLSARRAISPLSVRAAPF